MNNSRRMYSGYHPELSVTNGSFNKQNQSRKKKLNINNRFLLSSVLPVGYFYKTYKGIDLQSRKFVTIYIKPSSKDKMFSKIFKEDLREKIAPPLKWTGTEKLDKNLFDIQVHAKFGPSLAEVMQSYKKRINQPTFFLLSYHLLKLVDRIDNAGYVSRSLNLNNIILSQSYLKNDLYFLNTFDLQRKNQQSFSMYDKKYCSISTHLRLKTCSKDTLESMCYILMDFYLKGTLFDQRIDKEKHFLQAKNILQPQGIPIAFLQFFQYVRKLNYGEEIKFTQWKIKFKKFIPQSQYIKPYEWVQFKQKNDDPQNQTNQTNQNLFQSLFRTSPKSGFNKNNQYKSLDIQAQQLQLLSDKMQLEESIECIRMQDKIFKINDFTHNKY